jgi:hypothetical protein
LTSVEMGFGVQKKAFINVSREIERPGEIKTANQQGWI